MHGGTIHEKKRKVAEIAAFLWAINYRCIRHIESDSIIPPGNTPLAMEGHLCCQTA
jgi:hypothetical protein